jgi:hypothetical protein
LIVRGGTLAIGRMLMNGSQSLGIGVGSGDWPESHLTASLASDGLLGAAWHRPLDAGFPHLDTDGHTIIAQATFDPGEACFEWTEWCLFLTDGEIIPHHELASTGAGAVMLTRSKPVDTMGVKEAVTRTLRVPIRFHLPD